MMTTGIVVGGALIAWYLWLQYRSGNFATGRAWMQCPCGHAAAWHAHKGGDGYDSGCRSKSVLSHKSDPYGYCTCPRTTAEVLAGASEEVLR